MAYRAGILEIEDSKVLEKIWDFVFGFFFQLLDTTLLTCPTTGQEWWWKIVTKEKFEKAAKFNEFAIHTVYVDCDDLSSTASKDATYWVPQEFSDDETLEYDSDVDREARTDGIWY